MKFSEELKSIFTLSKWTDKAFIEQQTSKSNIPTVDRGDFWEYFSDANGHNYFKYESAESSLTAYRRCPPVTAIINKKAQAFINGKTWLLNTQGKAKGKEATSREAQIIKKLFGQPNPLQSGKQFEAQNYIYQQLSGFVIVLPIKPYGFKDLIDTTSLWNIPPHMVEIKEKKFKPFAISKVGDLIDSITIVSGGERTPLNVDEVIIIKDFTPSFDSTILPDSRIKSLEMPINNIIGAYESRNVLINQRGPQRVISSNKTDESGNIPLTPGEKEQIHKDFRKYGLRKNQIQEIITAANINVTPIGFSTRDLMLFEEIEGSTMAICDNFGYPYRLMASEKSASYNDVSEFKKMLYQDTIIPEAESAFEQWDVLFKTSDLNIKFDKDYSHVAVLQEDEQKKASARNVRNQAFEREWRNGLIKLNEWRVANGDDPMEDERGEMYFPEYVAKYGDSQKTQSNNHNAPNDTTTTEKVIINNVYKYDPTEPRDSNGRWTDGGASIAEEFIEATHERRKELNIPPAWTDVKVNKNKEADLLATGFDSKGRKQYIYSENATMRAAAAKFERNKELIDKHHYINEQNRANMLSTDKSISEPAHVMHLINSTGIRPGSLKETGAKVKAYGATTLEGRHVVETAEGVRLQFVGKKGVSIDIPVSDRSVASMLLKRKQSAGDSGRLFSASDSDLRTYTKKLDGGGFKPKDFRTLKGTATALELVKDMKPAKNMTEYKKAVMGVAKKVSQVLGNTPSIALKSYINPFVFLHLKPV